MIGLPGRSARGLSGVLLLLASAGCVDPLLAPEPAGDPETLFDLVWTEFDRHYALFDGATADWDALRAEYRPRVGPMTTPRELFGILSEMLDHLRDGHVNLWTPFGAYEYDGWHRGHPENFNRAVAHGHLRNGPRWSRGRHVAYGRLSAVVGYLHIPSFDGHDWIDEVDAGLDALDGVGALVLDLRSNGGGSDRMTEAILARFMDRTRVYRHFRYRNGPEHDDFTDLIADRIEPAGHRFRGPVAVLTNRRNYSAAESFVLGMRTVNGVVTVGDTTGGGVGNPIHRELPNGWTYRLFRWQLFTADRVRVPAGEGLAPDVTVSISAEDRKNGRDTILERAEALLLERLAEGG